MSTPPERPTLLNVGAGLTALFAALKLLAFTCLGGLLEIGMAGGMADSHGDDWVGFFAGGVAIALLGCLVILFFLVELLVCYKALSMRRFWLWALIGFSALGLASFPFGTAVGVITIVGCAQAFERLAPSSPLPPPARENDAGA